MKQIQGIFIFMVLLLLWAVPTAAAPAQKYGLMTYGGKLTAYVVEDEVYVRPEELASACAGTNLAFDISYADDAYKITLGSDFSGDLQKLRSKSSYEDVPVTDVTFTVEGFDNSGSIRAAVIEEKPFLKLKELGSITGFAYMRNKTTGAVVLLRQPSAGTLHEGRALSAGKYIDLMSDILYNSMLASDDMRVASRSADIARLLVPADYTPLKISQGSPLAPLAANSMKGMLTEADTRDVDPDKPMVAITFDDGPREGNTEQILEALEAVDGRATFFMVGTNVENYPDTVKAVAEQGSEIGNHTYNHPQLTTLGTSGAMEQINHCNSLIADATGVTPVIGRPPYGSIDADIISASGMDWFNWSVDTLDWKSRNADSVCSVIMENVGDRDVILMHDIHGSTVEAALRIIPWLHEQGYQLVTISELAEVQGGAENVSGYIRE
ncbi:MAG: polysaccharide deacetylase family protein [Firmicutes bacterium]|nr:polysaccharide deacetylase family protein [Bacillota bacterium]